MNLVVDTSVWSLVLRRRQVRDDDAYVLAFRSHVERGDGLLLVGPILQELLGVRWLWPGEEDIIPRERIEISPKFQGTVKWIGVKKGDEVLKIRDENGFPSWTGWRRR